MPNKENFDRDFRTKLLMLIGKLLIDSGNRSKKLLKIILFFFGFHF